MKPITQLLLLICVNVLIGQVDYQTQIQTIFNNNCTSCHIDGGAYYGGLDLSTYNNVMTGGNSGAVIVPNDHANSYLWQRVNNGEMPPGTNPDLTASQVDLIALWIDEGALENPVITGLVINEFLASNEACCIDNNGDYDDYIEIYNYGEEAVDIGGLFITDDIGNYDDYYQIPVGNDSTIIQPGSFLLLWADKESEQGVLHVEIKLSKDGEQIGLFMPDSTTVVDTLTFGEQSDDVSYGRYPDGSDTWQLMNPTPGITNTQELRSNVDLIIPSQYTVHQNYPNPFNPVTTLRYDLPENGYVNITIYDMMGRQVKTLINQTQDTGYRSVIWDATNDYGKPVSAGIYLYQIQAGEYMQTKKMVLLK